jgi:putative heme-binding domain-containing protein
LQAIRVLARVTPEQSGRALLALLSARQPEDIQSAAARALSQLDDRVLATTVFDHWNGYPPATRLSLLAAAPRSTALSAALANALESRLVAPVELNASVRQALLAAPDAALKQRFHTLLASGTEVSRQEVVARFQPALKLQGNRQHGAALFARTCMVCHTIEGRGGHVGPDLSGIASRPKDALLDDILDPSAEIAPDFINYTLTLNDGRIIGGFIASESTSSVTVRPAGEAPETIPLSQVKDVQAEKKSLMPEGLEQGLTYQDMADLLSFLHDPDGKLLSQPVP